MTTTINLFTSLSKQLKASSNTLKSFYTEDPITGNVVIHGATNNRPKAYAGEIIDCPWDNPKTILLQRGNAFLVPNDFPALSENSASDPQLDYLANNIYRICNARGECLIVIYSKQHKGHWLTLNDETLNDVVALWAMSTKRAQEKGFQYAHIFENDGPLNSMHHPHGQQYNLMDIPPFQKHEIRRAQKHFAKTGKNIFDMVLEAETKNNERIIYENEDFIVFAAPGAKWPFQVRILPKKRALWVFEFSENQQKQLADVITKVRKSYAAYFTNKYKPTFMMNLIQAPFDNEELYRQVYGFRIDIFCTALSDKAEKLMFSLENATGLIAYSTTPEEIAEELRTTTGE
ncbi:galactose-1-phosphate uridylyltransferase [Candidatus Microgenomates bacterium]|nr:MAG: galactose-1-phosphate uridylyltransferase [Candidatus Microgenomates bacterium]